MQSRVGRSLELFFIDGKPDGMLTAKVFNWTGLVLMTPRTQIVEALARPEASYTGVYLLLGDRDGQDLAYIGEGEDIAKRIRSHEAKRDWWTSAVLMTAAGNNLHKSHVQYLEARLVEQARAVSRVELENSVVPQRPTLSEADLANMEVFLDYLGMVLPALRVDMFLDRSKRADAVERQASAELTPRFELISGKHGFKANAALIDGEFVVEEGSTGHLGWMNDDYAHRSYAKLQAELTRSGVLVERGGHAVFVRSYAFKSPSAAASVVRGRSSNGRTNWRHVGSSNTYAEWEEEKLAPEPEPSVI